MSVLNDECLMMNFIHCQEIEISVITFTFQVKSDPSVQTILLLSRILHLSKLQEITLTLALLDSEKFEAFALQILKLKVPHFVRAYLEVGYNNSEQESNFAETPVKTLLQILHLVGSEKLELSPDLQKGLYSSLENGIVELLREIFYFTVI